MYRVVIVDDEEPVLESFSFILESEKEDFTLCGTARSGTEAINLIRDVKPDVVFMDIQMPGVDGLDAITELRPQYPEIVFVLATAYERFDIAQRAIPLGVFSYMVKPISRSAFVNELHRVKMQLDQTRERRDLQLRDICLLQKSREEIKNRCLAGLAWEDPSAEDWQHLSNLFDLKSDRGTVCLAEVRGQLSRDAREMLFDKLAEKFRFKFNCLSAMAAGRLILFFPEEPGLDGLDAYMQAVLEEFEPHSIALARGGVYHRSRLTTSFSEAYRSLARAEPKCVSFDTERDEMRSICAALLRGDFAAAAPLFEDFWTRRFMEDSFDVAKGKMVALFTLLWTGMDPQILGAADFNPPEAIMALRDVEEWRQWSSSTLITLRNLLCTADARPLPHHLSKSLSLIQERYREPISLSSIAEECQITANYLCRLFAEHLGTSFVDYLTRYRVEQATTMLKETSLSIKEVAGLAGFQDPNYFSRIFRRYTGLSPTDLVNRRTHNDNSQVVDCPGPDASSHFVRKERT
ncbi:response regulator transcription factor [Salinispira pacifica]